MVYKKSLHYVTNKSGTYYLYRRVPKDFRHLYKSDRISISLRTKDPTTAQQSASAICANLEKLWASERLKLITENLLPSNIGSTVKDSACLTFSEASAIYLKLKNSEKSTKFKQDTIRNTKYLLTAVGDKPLDQYIKPDAGSFRDYLITRGLVIASVRRIFGSIISIFNIACSEIGLTITNPFTSTYFPSLDDSEERIPVSSHGIKALQKKCIEADDEPRWLLALISDTGMRLSEAAGLETHDIVLNTRYPHIDLKPNSCRTLKTKSSSRQIPLVGVSLWSARRIICKGQKHAFPSYIRNGKCNANSASATINKWIKSNTSETVSVHSFRHSMRDRLRTVECPSEIVDCIGGWARLSIGQKYGTGYPLEVVHQWMTKIT